MRRKPVIRKICAPQGADFWWIWPISRWLLDVVCTRFKRGMSTRWGPPWCGKSSLTLWASRKCASVETSAHFFPMPAGYSSLRVVQSWAHWQMRRTAFLVQPGPGAVGYSFFGSLSVVAQLLGILGAMMRSSSTTTLGYPDRSERLNRNEGK